ncbi:MAG: glycosyltransferase family 1 protein [Hydrocarboniphaga sp.]|uniref:glycosyltransferase family 4 protein n=1 Tax=Hydrocarboniphaga sp. TaxID=2033016 RepID=UPI002613FF78|nr:glycosyltransferase family 1 protein [Hydrocarboniphaga sp.]MDB5972036.1 glycosyltransferase family 1 protein [Hydrocarboniphaga sp.]
MRPRATLLFDVSRLASRAGLAAPTGIDRVDLAYLQALAEQPDFESIFERRLSVIDRFGLQLLSPRAEEALLRRLALGWPSTDAVSSAFEQLRDWLQSPGQNRPAPRLRAPGRDTEPPQRWLQRALMHPLGAHRLQRLLAAQPRTIYLNTSHGRLFQPAAARWLQSSGASGVFFVHDLIPITHPQYNRPREPARHAARLRTIARHARAVIVNSVATREALLAWWCERQLRQPEVHVLPLGIGERFMQTPRHAVQAALPYFVAVGTLEPRKNHALLLDLWQRWLQQGERRIPRLLLIGRRGWQNQTLFERLDRDPLLAPHVAEVSGLADHEVAALLAGARALLNPSFAEGYGLPLAEALALGTPALVSDVPAHREVGGSAAEYLAAADSGAWDLALRDYAADLSPRRTRALERAHAYRSPSWNAHFAVLFDLLRHLDRGAA